MMERRAIGWWVGAAQWWGVCVRRNGGAYCALRNMGRMGLCDVAGLAQWWGVLRPTEYGFV